MSSAGAPIPDFELPYTSYGYGGQNGRVNLNALPSGGGSTVPDSAGFSYPKQTEVSFSGDMLRGNWDHTPLSDAFFTRKNVDIIQKEIRKEVYRMSGPKQYVIDDQDVDELKMIMRAMYLQHSKNLEVNIPQQIQELNNFVLNYCITSVFNEAVAYLKYKEDASTMHRPMQHPIYSNKTSGVN